jgi:hypothetical protein
MADPDQDDASEPSPFPPGTLVCLTKPNTEHPRRGATGEVVAAHWFEPVYQLRRGAVEKILVRPGRWLLFVRVRKATWADWRERGLSDETYGVYAGEVEALSGGRSGGDG